MDKMSFRFVPAGLVLCTVCLVVASLFLAMIATSVLPLRGGITVYVLGRELYSADRISPSSSTLLLKFLLAAAVTFFALRLSTLDEGARVVLIAILVVVGMVVPAAVSPVFTHIDAAFVKILRFLVFASSSATVYYLARPDTAKVFREGGIEAMYVYRYCPICETRMTDRERDRCPACDGDLLDRYESADGMVFAKPAGGDTFREALPEGRA